MTHALNGTWCYRSFRHEPVVVNEGKVVGEPNLAIPWSPAGELKVATDGSGQVMGTLQFAPGVVLEIEGRVIGSSEKAPASVELIGAGLGSVNRIKGFFIPGSDHVVGTIMCVAGDLAKRPNGTLGPFVLFPLTDRQRPSAPTELRE